MERVTIEKAATSTWFVKSGFSFDVATSESEARQIGDVVYVMAELLSTGFDMNQSEMRSMVSIETTGSVSSRIAQAKKLASQRSIIRRRLAS